LATRKRSATTPRPPATTPDGRERQLIAAAYDLAEQQIRDGTATAQVITHFLKLGTEREKLERTRLQGENRLLEAKVDSLASASRVEELYKNALAAMKSYAGRGSVDESEE
jgi:hypothetical protein